MIENIKRNLKEIVTFEELEKIVKKEYKKAYIGFEPSGLVHLGWLMCGDKIKDLVDVGFDFYILLADWHAWINDKLNGDLEAIRVCGEYIKDAFSAMGLKNVKYVYASEIVKDSNYWKTVIKIAKETTLARAKRAMDIMGRKEEAAEKDISKFFYPLMQVADIFYLDVDVALGGIDQRHAHMLARDVSDKLGKKKVVALHTPLISSLQAKERMDAKMSKSKPESAIFIHDDFETIKRKINRAYCPPQSENNPVMEITKHIIFQHFNEVEVANRNFSSYEELEKSFISREIHFIDLKNSVAEYLEKIISPVRNYFSRNPKNLEVLMNYLKK